MGYYERKYGITQDDYDHMLAEQGGVCAICGRPPKTRRLSVDHNHKTGIVRGVLCHICNRGISYFRDDPERLQKAAAYLAIGLDRVTLMPMRDKVKRARKRGSRLRREGK